MHCHDQNIRSFRFWARFGRARACERGSYSCRPAIGAMVLYLVYQTEIDWRIEVVLSLQTIYRCEETID